MHNRLMKFLTEQKIRYIKQFVLYCIVSQFIYSRRNCTNKSIANKKG